MTSTTGRLRDELAGVDWQLTESGFDPEQANVWETLFTVGNGRMGTRGSLEEGHLGEMSGTFLSGVYDGFQVPVINLVNAPDWLSFEIIADGERLDVQTCRVVDHERRLDYRHGLLWRRTVFEDREGRRTQLETLRYASFADRRLCGLRVEVTPIDHDAELTVVSALTGRRRNLERLPVYPPGTEFPAAVRWEKWARSKHLAEVSQTVRGEATYLQLRTLQSDIELGYGAVLRSSVPPLRLGVRHSSEMIEHESSYTVGAGQTARFDKFVAIATSRDGAPSVQDACLAALSTHVAAGFDAGLAASRAVWEAMWADCDCEIEGDPEATRAVRFGLYQLLIAANGDDPTVNIGAKSLSGEGYRGHVFWDTEVLMLPFFIYTQPDTARSLLRYRHHTLPGAREVAAESGLRGARFPWESADSGREECPIFTPDGANRFWTRDEEIHVSADVAYGMLTYAAATRDVDFLIDYGAETLFETSRFWVSRVEHDPVADSYVLRQVMGPDEFHSHVDNNAFTNRLAQWHLNQAVRLHDRLADSHPAELTSITDRLQLERGELDHWREVAAKIAIGVDRERGVIEQFEGYFDRLDVPITEWDSNDMPRYPVGYHHFNCEETMLLKQPDVVMLMHMLPDEFDQAAKKANFEFYEARTLHKSSLSPAIHAIMGIAVGDTERALQYFYRSAYVDLTNNQGNTDEGIHIASAGGTWQILVCGFGGFRVRHDQLSFDPWLPQHWQRIRFRLRWRGNAVAVSIGHDDVQLCLDGPPGFVEEVLVRGEPVVLTAGVPVTVALRA